ncbi:MAG: VanW family protein [Clostridiales bacterium]|nr:VanW family protein [Clostridiales bacterium]MCF8023531.1 VanW family protein [Clostridiales bacterium]
MNSKGNAPQNRSQFRLYLGKQYFTLLRYISWYLSCIKYAKTLEHHQLPFCVFSHKTPLLRKLRNVDMWLQYNKITNLKLAASKVSGIVVKPGETFSFWRLIGRPAKHKGYLKGMVLQNGSYSYETGGGLCQLSNLIYWMTLHTPLTVVERWRHNYDVFPDANRTQPFGSGATVAYNYIDLQVHNNTSVNYQLLIHVGENYLHGEWRSTEPCNFQYEVYQSDHAIIHEPWGGYTRHNSLRRKIFSVGGKEIADEFITKNNAVMMYNPLLGKVCSDE